MSLIPRPFISRDNEAAANNLKNSKHFLFREFHFSVFFSFHPHSSKRKRYSYSHLDLLSITCLLFLDCSRHSIGLQAVQQRNCGSIPCCVSSLAAPSSALLSTQPPFTGYSRRCVGVTFSMQCRG